MGERGADQRRRAARATRWHKMARRWRTPVLGELVQAWIPRSAWRSAMQRSNPKGLPPEFVDKMYDDYDRGTRRTVLKLYRATPGSRDAAAAGRRSDREAAQAGARGMGRQGPLPRREYAERQREFFDVRDLVILRGAAATGPSRTTRSREARAARLPARSARRRARRRAFSSSPSASAEAPAEPAAGGYANRSSLGGGSARPRRARRPRSRGGRGRRR